MSTNYDFAIIGGGNAGLSLARNLTYSDNSKKIIVIEPIEPINKQANWCSWLNEADLIKHKNSIKGVWDRWKIIHHNEAILHQSSIYQYACIDSSRYLIEIEQLLLDGRVEIAREGVQSIISENNQIICDSRTINAMHIYDSRPPKIKENSLIQHFSGIEVELSDGIKNHEFVTLMDFRVDQKNGLHFIYALPFSSTRIFVESTVISKKVNEKSWYKEKILQWLKDQNLKFDAIISEEHGVIPQYTQEYNNTQIHQIGSRGGATRLASGYAFHNINKQIDMLSKNIENNEHRVPEVMSRFLINMDTIFNAVIINNPSYSPDIFIRMAKSISGDQFAEFMLNKANINTWYKVVKNMPKTPFIKESIKRFFGQ